MSSPQRYFCRSFQFLFFIGTRPWDLLIPNGISQTTLTIGERPIVTLKIAMSATRPAGFVDPIVRKRFIREAFREALRNESLFGFWMSAEAWSNVIQAYYHVPSYLSFNGSDIVDATRPTSFSVFFNGEVTGVWRDLYYPKGQKTVCYYATSLGQPRFEPDPPANWQDFVSDGAELLSKAIRKTNFKNAHASPEAIKRYKRQANIGLPDDEPPLDIPATSPTCLSLNDNSNNVSLVVTPPFQEQASPISKMLQDLHPKKSEAVLNDRKDKAKKRKLDDIWNTERKVFSLSHQRTGTSELEAVIRAVSGDNVHLAASAIESLLKRSPLLRDTVEKRLLRDVQALDSAIISCTGNFISRQRMDKGGSRKKEDQQAVHAALTASTFGIPDSITSHRIAKRLKTNSHAVNKARTTAKELNDNNELLYGHLERKIRDDCIRPEAMYYVTEFCHSDCCSRVESNKYEKKKFKNLNGEFEEHTCRTWEGVSTLEEKYEAFSKSSFYDRFKIANPGCTIGPTLFRQCICPCVANMTLDSCVDLILVQLEEYMKCIHNNILFDEDIKKELQDCTCSRHIDEMFGISDLMWERELGGRPQDFIKHTCCPAVSHPDLATGIGSDRRVPSFTQWDCAYSKCAECGTEKKLRINECPVLSQSEKEVKVMEWDDADRGQGNSQRELTEKHLKLKDVIKNMCDKLAECREHVAEYEWINHCRKLHLTMSNPNKVRCILTDFAATPNLRAAKADNCSVDNHAVLCVMYAVHNWRVVKYKNKNGTEDETIVNDCDAWHFWGDTMSKGKKNDHVFHNACLDYVVSYYDTQRESKGLPPIKENLIWTDNCPTQYRCRQNFIKLATFSERHRNASASQLLAAVYKFKGCWDAAGKTAKSHIVKRELQGERLPQAYQCFVCTERDLSNIKKKRNYAELEEAGHPDILKNTTFTLDKRFWGLATENKREYDGLVAKHPDKHIVFTDREIIPDSAALPRTTKLHEIKGRSQPHFDSPDPLNRKWIVRTACLPCACPFCRGERQTPPCRHIGQLDRKEEVMQRAKEYPLRTDAELRALTDLNILIITELKAQLRGRGLSDSHQRKADLVSRLKDAIAVTL